MEVYNKFIDTNKYLLHKIFDSTVLNPAKCSSEGLMCDPVIIYIIAMIIFLVIIFIYKKDLGSKWNIFISFCLIVLIFFSGLLILVNLCLYQKPTMHSIIVIALAIVASYIVLI